MKTTTARKPVGMPALEQMVRSSLHAAAKSSRMSRDETSSFVSHAVARSIAATPFVAGCVEPKRTSLALLTIYIAANRSGVREAFDHDRNDNQGSHRFEVALRLLEGGNASVIRAAVARWELVTLYGQARDLQKDLGFGQYNPLAQGGWNYDAKAEVLWSDSRFGEIEALDLILGDWNVTSVLW